MKESLARILLTALLILPAQVFAEEQTFGDYTIYYQAVNSTFINSDIAEQYGIVRSDRRAFLNISVQKDGNAVHATVTGEIRNLLSRNQPIEFNEIREVGAIYYIGQFQFSNAQTVRFNVQVKPEDTEKTYTVTWTTKMYNE